MGSLRVRHGWATSLSLFTFTFHFHALEKEMATHSSVLAWRIQRDIGAWWAAVYGVAQSRTWLKQLSSSRWIDKCVLCRGVCVCVCVCVCVGRCTHTYTVEYYWAIKRMKFCHLLQHEWTWRVLVKYQRKSNTVTTYMWNLKNKINKYNKQT